jgi:HK97 family phage major capsid protein
MSKDITEILADVTKELNRVSSEFSSEAEKALKQAREAGELSAETKNSVDKLATTFNSLNTAHTELKARLGELEGEFTRLPRGAQSQKAESLGATVIKSQALKDFAASVEGGKRVNVPVNAALLSADIPAGVVEPQRLPGIDVLPKQRLFIRDLITGGRTTSPAIFWVQQTGFTNAARVVAENTTKPYSGISFEPKMTAVSTIAHMFKASKQILDDFTQLMGQIDAEMRFGLKYAEEAEVLFGDGTGVHLHGIVPQAQDFEPAFTVERQNSIDVLRLAMLQAQLARLPATGHVLHFTDWARIELTKDEIGRYILANPLGLAGPVLWGLPVVATELAAFLGKFLTGAFRDGAQLFDREDANVVISTENADDFEKNMISIRCEERTALIVKRPEAFIFGDLPSLAAGTGTGA